MGLALSGGGARGGAHIGVLAALEELRVPIDCIAGTSVGAAIGGFYAAGLRPDEIERIARAIDWDAAFSNAMPRPDRSFRRKHDDFLFLVNFQPGLRARRIALPVGFVQGQVIDMTLSRAIGGSYPTPDFDRLPIPFRAVATDMTTGEAVVLGSGDLALALRASMSLPAVLAPIDLDGRMLADGGLAMNLPVSAVQALGADVVLAVDASSALLEREKMRSVLDVTSQLTTLMTRPAMEQQKRLLRAGDILLTPVLETPQTFMSFATFDRTIGDGYRAVMDQRERFAAWSLDVERYAAYLADRHRARGLTPPRVDFVRLDNRSSIADRVIEARIGGIALGAPLDVPAVEAAVRRVYGLGLFQNVRYSVVATDAGTTGVEIRVDERAWGPSYFQMGLHYASSSTADTLFGVAASYLRTGINERGGEWRATVALGDEPEALADFYQPLGPEAAFFVEAQFAAESSVYNVFSGDSVSTAFDVRQTGLEASAGRVLGDTVELRAGLRSGEGAYHLRIGDPSRLPGGDFRRREVFVRLESDKLDSVAFPRAGSSSSVEWHSSRPEPLEGARFQQLSVRFQAARTWRRHTVLGTVRYDTTVSGDAPLYARFRVGGFRDLSGLTRGELVGQNAARIGLSYYREIGDFAMFPAFAGVSLERGNVWDDRRAIGYDDAIGAASLWAGIATPIGPVYLGAGRTGDGRRAVYLSLGGSF